MELGDTTVLSVTMADRRILR